MSSGDFVPVIKSLWKLINVIFTSRWNILLFKREKALTIRKCVSNNLASLFRDKAIPGLLKSNIKIMKEKSSPSASTPALLSISSPPPSMIAPPLSKKNETINKKKPKSSNTRKSYVQVSKSNILPNIENVLRIKEVFPSLSADKVGKMIKAINGSERKKKPSINMTTRGLLRKQVIVSIAKSNTELIVHLAY